MPASDLSERTLTREQQIQLLRLACAGDRLELALTMRRTSAPVSVMELLLSRWKLAPWFQTAAQVLAPLLPRKLRWFVTVTQLWRGMQKRD